MPNKQNKCTNTRTIKFGNAKQAEQMYQYKNNKIWQCQTSKTNTSIQEHKKKTKLYKTKAAILYNKTCRLKQLTPKYISIKLCTNLALFPRQNLHLSSNACTGIAAAV
jgi:hypothetical protein